jgi:hypothetical protein
VVASTERVPRGPLPAPVRDSAFVRGTETRSGWRVADPPQRPVLLVMRSCRHAEPLRARPRRRDRRDLVGSLDASTDGLERRIDVAEVNDRLFLNNVSLGIYGDELGMIVLAKPPSGTGPGRSWTAARLDVTAPAPPSGATG